MTRMINHIPHPTMTGVPSGVTIKDTNSSDQIATSVADGNPLAKNAQPGKNYVAIPNVQE